MVEGFEVVLEPNEVEGLLQADTEELSEEELERPILADK
jgi:hypothetical protein